MPVRAMGYSTETVPPHSISKIEDWSSHESSWITKRVDGQWPDRSSRVKKSPRNLSIRASENSLQHNRQPALQIRIPTYLN